MSKFYAKSTLSRKFRLNPKRGFTLLEILLVVGIISILAGIVIVAINPGKQLATVRNTERKSDLKQLYSAITQYYITEGSYPSSLNSITELTEICDTGTATTSSTCGDLVNLTALVPTYITAIPVDPQGPVTALLNKLITPLYAITGGTGYYVMKDTTNKLVLNTERAELGTVIAIGTTTAMSGGGEEEEEWTCGDSLIDTRDDQSYATVLIGSQCWMQENLNVGTMISGPSGQTDNDTLEKYCYSNSESNCTTHGGLYQWDEAMQYVTTAGAQGICPTGWHIPTDTEYKTLVEGQAASGCESYISWQCSPAGSRLSSYTLNGDNTSGFSALLAGYRGTDGSFNDLGSQTYLWSSLESGTSAWFRNLYSGFATVYRHTRGKAVGFSVRCLKD
jgi:uncharacterized protein (TIGR02145 family)/prepilin-type N-terminal cleavage/methylation domain-containing protein